MFQWDDDDGGDCRFVLDQPRLVVFSIVLGLLTETKIHV